MLSDHEIERYSRQTIMPELDSEGQQKLKLSSVLVIGAGGLGVPVLQYLTAAGVGNIVLVDHDEVSLSNLHRQVLYNESDIGQSKTDVARAKLNLLNSDINLVSHAIRLDSANISSFLNDIDLVIDGSDNFETRYLVNDACVLHQVPLVYGGVNKLEGQVAVFNVSLENEHRSAHYRDLYPQMPEPGSVMSCAEVGVLGPVTGIIGSIMATEAIKVLTGIGEPLVGRMLHIDCNSMAFREIRYNPVSTYTITDLDEYAPFCLIENRLISWKDIDPKLHYIVDVRQADEKIEFDAGGVLIPLNALSQRYRELPEDRPVVFYCKTGIRSDQAVQVMARLTDRKDVFSIKGGIFTRNDFQG